MPIPFRTRAIVVSKVGSGRVGRRRLTNNHPIRALGCTLQSGRGSRPYTGPTDGGSPSVPVTQPAAEDTSDESARKIVARIDATLEHRVVDLDNPGFLVPVTKAHELDVVSRGVDTTHQTLVIAEEEDGDSGDEADHVEEATLLQLVGDIVLAEPALELAHDG